MQEIDKEKLRELMDRADQAKRIGSEIDLLTAYDRLVQEHHIRLEFDGPQYPDAPAIHAMLEAGKLARIGKLKNDLWCVLNPSEPKPA